MQTYRECIYMIFDELNLSSDDSKWEVEHLIFLLNKYRAILTKQRYGGSKKDVPLEYYQLLDLGEVPRLGNPNDKRKTYCFNKEIPQILNLNGILLETSISYHVEPPIEDCIICGDEIPLYDTPLVYKSCIICGVPIPVYNSWSRYEDNIDVAFINPDRFKYIGYNKWLTNIPYATLGYDHKIYISSTSNFLKGKYFRIQGVFEVPTDFVDTTEKKLSMYFPVEEALLQPIIDLTVKELQNILFLPNDTINNSADDQHISIEKYALPKRAANTTIN